MMDFVRLKEFTFRLGKDVRSGGSATADIGPFGCHHSHELHVGFQWKRDNWIVGTTAL
jgi:hypothetical protein